jgi:hypothetical protein
LVIADLAVDHGFEETCRMDAFEFPDDVAGYDRTYGFGVRAPRAEDRRSLRTGMPAEEAVRIAQFTPGQTLDIVAEFVCSRHFGSFPITFAIP